MKKTKTVLCLLALSCFARQAFAAPRFWVSSSASNWNNTANWSAASGGAGGAAVPVAGDDVTFDASAAGNCVIDAAVSVKTITVSGYTGTISQGANSIATTAAATFGSGTFTGGSANITILGIFTLSGTAFTSTSAVLELQNSAAFTSGSFTHNNGTVRFKTSIATATISGTSPVFYILEFVGLSRGYTITATGSIIVANNLIISGSSFYNLNTGAITVLGDINVSNTATGCGGDATITIGGTGTQNFNGATTAGTGSLPQLTVNKPSGTLNLANFPAVSNNFTYTAGTVNAGTSTFCFTHGNTTAYSITGSLSLNNIEFTINTSLLTATLVAGTTLTAAGDLTIDGAGGLLLQTGAININGNIWLTNTATNGGGTATISIVGAGAEIIDGTAIIVNQSRLPPITINKTTGTLSLAGNISFANNITYSAGAINAGTSTSYLVSSLTVTGNLSLYNIIIQGTSTVTVTIAAGSTLTAAGTLDMENGAGNISVNTGILAVQGNMTDNNTGIGGGGTGTILINGPGTQTITSTGVIDQGRLPGVSINKSAGTLVLPSLITVRSDWNYQAGTIDAVTNGSTVVFENTMNIIGTQTLNNITFDGSNNFNFTTAPGTTVTVLGNISMIGTGNITLNTGTYNLQGNLALSNTGGGGGTSVIAFTGSGAQAITSTLPINQNCLPSVTINKTGGTLIFPALITVRGNWTYTAGTLDVTTNASTVVFADPLGSGLFSITGTHTLNNVTLEANNNNTLNIPTGTLLTVIGNLNSAGTANLFINSTVPGATVIQAEGNISIGNTGASGGGMGQILINGPGAQLFSSLAGASQGPMPFITIQKTAGTLTMTGIITESRSWTYSSGTVDAVTSGSTVVFGGNNLTVTSAGMNFYHVIVAASTSTLANNLTILGNLTINGSGILAPGANTINLAGNWTDRATIGFTEATGTVNFNGASGQTITTPGGENFTNLTINNSSTGIQLENAVAVATGLTMTRGNIDLNGNALTLGTGPVTTGALTYTSGNIIDAGSFTRWLALATIPAGGAAGLFPMGTVTDPRPFSVSATTAPTTGGTITVAYTDATTNTATSFADGAATIVVRKDLHWAVTAATLAGGAYSLGISGTGYGLVGAVTDLRLVLANSIAGSPGANAGTVLNPQVNRTGLTPANLTNTFYPGSINAIASPLPITLLSFSATVQNREVLLDWSTAMEINNDYFIIQRSKDGSAWEKVVQVAAAGNSNTVRNYTADDPTPYNGLSFYRLVQTDLNGAQTYSAVRPVNFSAASSLSIYPNPAVDRVTIRFPATDRYEVALFSSNGREMLSPIQTNSNTLTFSVLNLPDGIYFIHVIRASGDELIKLVIKK